MNLKIINKLRQIIILIDYLIKDYLLLNKIIRFIITPQIQKYAFRPNFRKKLKFIINKNWKNFHNLSSWSINKLKKNNKKNKIILKAKKIFISI